MPDGSPATSRSGVSIAVLETGFGKRMISAICILCLVVLADRKRSCLQLRRLRGCGAFHCRSTGTSSLFMSASCVCSPGHKRRASLNKSLLSPSWQSHFGALLRQLDKPATIGYHNHELPQQPDDHSASLPAPRDRRPLAATPEDEC
ncbi:UNVERIFIED_ORG: hypothetical protein GGI57_004693 [Rhizobium aethiopicum]